MVYLKNRNVYDSLNFKAEDFFNNKEYNKAMEYYDQSIKLFPNDAFLKKRIAIINKIDKETAVPIEKNNIPSVQDKKKK